MSNKVVVFGGSGFLGSHLADSLTQEGYDVAIFDKVKSKYLQPNQEMIVGDILDLDLVRESVKDARYVYNFAGIADLAEAKKDPIKTVQLNILGNTHVLEASQSAGVERFIFASSLYVYSELGSFYRSSKQACELLIEDFRKKYGLNYTILRFGSLYGERANDSNFIYRIVRQALTEGKIIRHGDGEEIREYIHVKDAAKCSVEVLNKDFLNKHVMITGIKSTKISKLLEMINEASGNQIEIEYLDHDYDDEHYKVTPYTFEPRFAKKYIPSSSTDLIDSVVELISSEHRSLLENNQSLVFDINKLKIKESVN